MTALIHVLGSDIPHHNQTVLSFFNDVLSPRLLSPDLTREFYVVSRDSALAHRFPQLNIRCFASKKQIAQVLRQQAHRQPEPHFILHGQFNILLWLYLLVGFIRPKQVSWHIWGADLYEDSTDWRFRLFYRLRRIAQGRVGRVFATRGDLNYYHQRHPAIAQQLLYFPTKMDPALTGGVRNWTPAEPLNILVGNSGDRSNRHIDALREIKQQFGEHVRVQIPLGYPANNDAYISEIRHCAETLYPDGQVTLLTEQIPFNTYLDLLAQCDLGYFLFERQQGIGTLCLLIQNGVPFVLSRKNPFGQDLQEQHVPVLFSGEIISSAQIQAAQRALGKLDRQRIGFFNPNYIQGWALALQQAAGQTTPSSGEKA